MSASAPPPAHIRAATAADLVALAPPLAAQPLLRAYGAKAPLLAARWQEALHEPDQQLQVATLGPAPAAPAVALSWFSHRGAFAHGAYLRYVAVLEAAAGRGIGRQLLAAYEAATAAPSGWFLLVSDFNTGAQRFYRRQGYAQVGLLPGFVRPNITEHIFWKAAVP